MTASLWLVAALACAQLVVPAGPGAEDPARHARVAFDDDDVNANANANANANVAIEKDTPPPRPSASKIVAVTVYRGQALVTREVGVPEGEGTIELIVTPMPAQAVDTSLYAEGNDGLRVLSTRFRTRAVQDDTRREVRAKEELIRKLEADARRLQKEVAVQEQDLAYLSRLEGFTGTSLKDLTAKGRLDSEAILALSRFVMENRGAKTNAETDLHERWRANADATAFAKVQLGELSAGSSRLERDALIVVHKARREAGSVRLGYLVNSANWWPQYRLRGALDDAPVRLEYLAAVAQQTGEAWPDVAVTLSTARPSLDAAPPELLPLKMLVDDDSHSGPIDARDDRSQKIVDELEKRLDMPFANETPLEDVLRYVQAATKSATFPEGIPIYVDPVGLQEAEKTMTSPVVINLSQVRLKTSLKLLLAQIGLTYKVGDGLLKVISVNSDKLAPEEDTALEGGLTAGMGAMGGGMGGMAGGMGRVLEQVQASTSAGAGALLNRKAASDQARELRVADGPGSGSASATMTEEKDDPSVTFAIAGRLDIPSRRDPQLLEVARVELPAEYHAKAVPVLSPRIYRLARLTNRSELVLLPGDANVYVGADFVGRMRLPLVAAGEPFLAGFGVDPQLQVSRRLMRKSRTVQGGNQIFTYEFRIGLRNYRPGPVKVQLWDRLPRPQGEAVAVELVKASAELSTDAMYLRTARMDNLLRWDLDVPAGTVGDRPMFLTYEFRLEYARDLPQPHFVSGGLREGPIGGGALGGTGGMAGGFRSVTPGRD